MSRDGSAVYFFLPFRLRRDDPASTKGFDAGWPASARPPPDPVCFVLIAAATAAGPPGPQ
jgi:hypothetical protein